MDNSVDNLYKVGEKRMNIRKLYRYAQSKGYPGGQGPYFIASWLFATFGEIVYEKVGTRGVRVGS